MSQSFNGAVKVRVVDVRFALSGKVVNAVKHTGDTVKKFDLVASLDRKVFQTELDAQLADYEKVRADFEIFGQKNPDPQSPIDKYLKTEKQADLNGSVKEVELAKAKLDQADLFSPVEGVILDDSGVVSGQYITPASASIKVIDTSSYYFEFEIDQKDVPGFQAPKKCSVEIEGIATFEGETKTPFSDGKVFSVKVPIANNPNILLGMKGVVEI